METQTYNPGDKLSIGIRRYTVKKTAPGKVLLSGCGDWKWLKYEEIEEMKKKAELKEKSKGKGKAK